MVDNIHPRDTAYCSILDHFVQMVALYTFDEQSIWERMPAFCNGISHASTPEEYQDIVSNAIRLVRAYPYSTDAVSAHVRKHKMIAVYDMLTETGHSKPGTKFVPKPKPTQVPVVPVTTKQTNTDSSLLVARAHLRHAMATVAANLFLLEPSNLLLLESSELPLTNVHVRVTFEQLADSLKRAHDALSPTS